MGGDETGSSSTEDTTLTGAKETAESAVTTAKEAVDTAQAKLDELQNQYNLGSIGWWQTRAAEGDEGAQIALKVIEATIETAKADAEEAGYTTVYNTDGSVRATPWITYGVSSTTSLDNMLKSIEIAKMINELRTENVLDALVVSDALTAEAQAQSNYGAYEVSHWTKSGESNASGEIKAWQGNEGTDNLKKGWYTDEKAYADFIKQYNAVKAGSGYDTSYEYYQQIVDGIAANKDYVTVAKEVGVYTYTSSGSTGHYYNIINTNHTQMGCAWAGKANKYAYTATVDFANTEPETNTVSVLKYNSETKKYDTVTYYYGETYTVDEYEEMLTTYINNLNKSIEDAKKALEDAQTAYTNAQNAEADAKTTLDTATSTYNTAKIAYDNAVDDAKANYATELSNAKEAKETAESDYSKVQETTKSASDDVDTAKATYDDAVSAETTAKTTYEDAVANVKTKTTERDNAKTTLSNAKTALETAEANQKTKQEAFDQLFKKVSDAQKIYNDAVSAEAEAKTTYENAVNDKNAKAEAYEQAKQDTADALEALNTAKSELEEAKSALEEAKNTTKEKQTAYDTASDEYKTLVEAVEKADKAAKALEEAINNYNTASNNASAKNEEYMLAQNATAQALVNKTEATSKVETLKQEAEDKQSNYDKLHGVYLSAMADYNSAKEAYDKAKEVADSTVATDEEALSKDLADKKEAVEQLGIKLDDAKASLEDAKVELDKANQTYEEAKTALAETSAELDAELVAKEEEAKVSAKTGEIVAKSEKTPDTADFSDVGALATTLVGSLSVLTCVYGVRKKRRDEE